MYDGQLAWHPLPAGERKGKGPRPRKYFGAGERA